MRRGILPIRVNAWLVLSIALLAGVLLAMMLREKTSAQEPLAQPPEGQTYVGTKECAACHFEQFMQWRGTPHAKAFEQLPDKYRTDSTCLKCHTTGHGDPTGFKSMQETPNLAGNSCEGCHGPGSKHTEIAKSFGQKKLTEQEQAYVRSTIHLMQPKNVCVECHLAAKHEPHPKFEK
jgi:hypothetical protein